MNGIPEAAGEYFARAMVPEDVPAILPIDRESFPNPWPAGTYLYELRENRASHLLVLERRGTGEVVGVAGYWLVVDEAHLSTFAVHPGLRSRGLGRLLLGAMLQDAANRGALSATLEVRAGNRSAQNLYRSFGFRKVGRRRGYYKDNGEDALLMTTIAMAAPAFMEKEER